MKAKYFYDRLLKYQEEEARTGKYYYGYMNRNCTIHHKGNEYEWFVIYRDGMVYPDGCYIHKRESMSIQELEGDDFELFNIVQIIKSGYITLTTESERDVKSVISSLHRHIGSYEMDETTNDKDKPALCGGSMWNNGLTDEFEYYDTTGTEVHIQTIRNLCKYNMNRKYYDVKCIPFIKSMKNESSFHVGFIENMRGLDYKKEQAICTEALSNLFSYLKTLNVEFGWVECKMDKPIYL